MHKELYVKCPKCSSEIKFNYYIKKFKCSKCNNVLELNDLNSQKTFYNNDINDKEKKLVALVNFSKHDFLKELQETLKGKMIPKCFKKINEGNLKLIYVPLIIYNAKFIVYCNNKYSLYKINNKVLTEFTDFDDLTLKSLFPIDIDSNIDNQDFEIDDYLILKFNKEKEKMLDLIESKVKEDLKYNLKLTSKKYDVTFLEDDIIEYFLPIYDYSVNYKNQNYHLAMNANTGKISVKIPINKFKIVIITISLLILDIIFFSISKLIRMIETSCLFIAIFLFLIELIIILYMYFSVKLLNKNEDNKNNFSIKKINL